MAVVEIVKHSISNGTDINAQSKGFGLGTALIYATSSNRTDVEYLIEKSIALTSLIYLPLERDVYDEQ